MKIIWIREYFKAVNSFLVHLSLDARVQLADGDDAFSCFFLLPQLEVNRDQLCTFQHPNARQPLTKITHSLSNRDGSKAGEQILSIGIGVLRGEIQTDGKK